MKNSKGFFVVVVLFLLVVLVEGVNFGDPSPDTGEADFGVNIGTFDTQSGNATDTRSDNNVYFAVGRSVGNTAAANQTLSFNLSTLTTNSSILITGINVTVRYCHARTVSNTCNGGVGASPQGTAGNMNISIYNVSGNAWFRLGTLNATSTATEITLIRNLTSLRRYGEFNTSSGFVNISFEFAWSGTRRSAFLNDHTNLTIMYDRAPVVTLNSPLNNSLVNPSSVTFNCSINDDFGIVNVTLYHDLNGSRAFIANQTNVVGGTDNSTTFTLTNVSEFNVSVWNCLALDTQNLSSFASANFTLDTSGLNVTPIGCIPLNINQNESTICNATITDNSAVTNVTANVTLPNGTSIGVLVQNNSNNYFFNFTQTSVDGRYNVTWKANDSLNNNKSISADFFIVGNAAPNVTLISPVNDSNSSNATQVFVFNVTDNADATVSCSLIFNNATNQTNSSTLVNINSSFTLQNIVQGQNNWSVSCTDSASLSDRASEKRINIDTSPPTFVSLTTIPDNVDGLDPQVDIVVQANVSDNITAVNASRVFLEHKRSNQNSFTQTTMTLDTTTGLYNATLNENAVGTYNLRVNATDIVGNTDVSTIVNITLERERTWVDSPSQLVIVASNFSLNGSVVYTVNNTGDFTLTFNITSNYSLTFFNESEQFNLLEKTVKTINITATAGTSVLTRFLLNTTAVDAADASIPGEPTSRTTLGTVVVAPNQPILVATITQSPASVKQGQSDVIVSATLENLGEGNASSVAFNVSLPSGWTITAGSVNVNVGNLSSGDSAAISLVAIIDLDATIGNLTLIANASGVNDTGADVESLGLVFSDTKNVVVSARQVVLGSSASSSAGSSSGAAAAGGGARPSLSVMPKLIRTLFTEEFLKTNETVEIVRGENASFSLKVTNVFENTTLSNVQLDMKGYLSQYLDHTPRIIQNIQYGENKSFMITVGSPGYFKKGVYSLIAEISGSATGRFVVQKADNSSESRNMVIKFREERNVTLIVNELEPELADVLFRRAERLFVALQDAHIPLKKAMRLWGMIQSDFVSRDWYRMQQLVEEFQMLHDEAFASVEIMRELEWKVVQGEREGFDVSGTSEFALLARKAFEREDFMTAKKRAEEGRLVEVLEVKKVFSLRRVLVRFWWFVLISTLFAVTVVFVFYKYGFPRIIDWRIKNLVGEEVVIGRLVQELEEAAFVEKTVSMDTYHQRMYAYEERLEEIKSSLLSLKTRRLSLKSPEFHIEYLKNEIASLEVLIKQTQEAFFVGKKIGHKVYDSRMREVWMKIAEVQEELVMAEIFSPRRNHAV